MFNILLRDDVRMRVGLDGIILSRQAKRIKSDWEQNIVALHAALSRQNLDTGISLDMSHMHTCTGRIREFYEAVPLRLFIKIDGPECARLFPALLPLLLHFRMIVWLCHDARTSVYCIYSFSL